jgi:predicted nucleic acid-binding protein
MVMDLFFDTSAIVPLLLIEPHSEQALEAWGRAERVWAWRWLGVEAEAAMGRRHATPRSWAQWRSLEAAIHWLDLGSEEWDQVRSFNRSLRLCAADAGHLFVFDRALAAIPEMALVCFDREVAGAAESLGLPVLR